MNNLSLLTQNAVQPLCVEFSQSLMKRRSITPDDAGCQLWLAEKLRAMGFDCHHLNVNGVANLIAVIGNGPITTGFAGHTDVVPAGNEDAWRYAPFAAHIEAGTLYGRGAADMKTGIAAMLGAWHRLLQTNSPLTQRFVWLITSDEEGEAEFGSKEIKAWLDKHNIHLDQVIVGEPTAHSRTGDTIKVGRRGAVSARMTIKGKAGHVAYPQQTRNAIHLASAIVHSLQQLPWDAGSRDFPGSQLQVTHIDSGRFTDNIVPERCEICFNVRFSHQFSFNSVRSMIEQAVTACTAEAEIAWERHCEPYFTNNTASGSLIDVIEHAIKTNTGIYPLMSTAGGTSDGRFFAGPNTDVVEIGVPNSSIHQIDEHVHISDLVTLEDIFTQVITTLMTTK